MAATTAAVSDLASLIRVIRKASEAAKGGRPLVLLFNAGPSRVRVTVRAGADGGGRTPDRTPCERDVIETLTAAAPAPMTTSRVLAELARRGALHGDQTVKVTLARLVKAGLVTASRRAPMGYRLAGAPTPP